MSKIKRLKILMLEDDAFDYELNKEQLLFLDEYDCKTLWVKDRDGYVKAIDEFCPDIVLSDFNLPGYDGLEALSEIKKQERIVPFVFVTGAINEETAAKTIKSGAWDYVVKDRLFRLPLAIRGVLQLKDERLKAQQVEELNKLLSLAIEQSPVQTVICGLDARIIYANDQYVHASGKGLEDIIGQNLKTVFDMPDEKLHFWKEVWSSIQEGKRWKGEIERKDQAGVSYWDSVSVSSIKDDQGTLTNIIISKEDITKRKQIENELSFAKEHAERSDRLKEAFLQNLSHEIRTPMNAIVGFSSILNDDEVEISLVQEYTKLIHDNSIQLLSIVSDILNMSKIQTGQERIIAGPVYINDIVEGLVEAYESIAKEKDIGFTNEKNYSMPVPVIISDKTKVRYILTSLLDNAFKFTDKGGVTLSVLCDNNQTVFTITDTGVGINKEGVEKIFERFRQADPSQSVKFGGTGLGLSICKSYIEMLGGDILVESEKNAGSTFKVILPYENNYSGK